VKRAVLLVILVACGSPAGDSVDGSTIYASMCAACHGPTGKPNEAMAARLGVKDLTDPAVRARLTPAHVEQQVRSGSENKLMPSFAGALTPAQIAAVAAFIASPAFVTPSN
jgi:mono/diheme cytochrome c family protein